ncbi:MAG: hypothetical protein ACD_44C00360G0007 [uncultured bacterium]|nr:MAG: hypothetical protein ACD_44C00360G0007 [uncultured bacterium]OGT17075.1 MAG: cytochrome C biogenesis protein [Gammaproteobacteria bacterium RIFCSPHIGHO2_02_FULL_38_33]OGT24437.1 MAG: cytochrome C biogenesis protein [Gammaproteobacteria bacterium RIFCSPHIGHO2_12_38_15]OGT68416.1 MAG: cytochrome C biogenesis protein [Gammaproteobacteria bacterium RIFCSPLOWO2_02_FULL_38_11]OGT77440.1 MAG: cytochrome C biogenesis protein [Gammaproteobacteria bacterium RIFCSPLOWO2_12_FULL_38_14]
MEYKDYYKILDVERGASLEEIKKSYRRLARKYHPDVSKEKNTEEKFKDVGEAYDVLQDPKKREAYDRLGNQWKAGEQFTPPPGWQFENGFSGANFSEGEASAFSDFFASLFGGGVPFEFSSRRAHTHQRQRPPMRGQDIHTKLTVTLEDVFQGATKELSLALPGQVSPKTLRVKIPKGILEGQQIRLAGQGASAYQGGQAGDLFIEVTYAPHSLFNIEKSDIYLKTPITPWEAALGASISVPTLGGQVEVKIPAGTQSGQKLRLKGRGIPSKTLGDQYLLLEIMTPPANTEEIKQFYKTMETTLPFDPRKGW